MALESPFGALQRPGELTPGLAVERVRRVERSFKFASENL
jgi:hypothetical protein